MFEKLKAVIEENLSVEGAEITENTDFKEDLGADSLDLFELVMALEEEFGIDIPSEDLEKLATVGDVMKYLATFGNRISGDSGGNGLGGGIPSGRGRLGSRGLRYHRRRRRACSVCAGTDQKVQRADR